VSLAGAILARLALSFRAAEPSEAGSGRIGATFPGPGSENQRFEIPCVFDLSLVSREEAYYDYNLVSSCQGAGGACACTLHYGQSFLPCIQGHPDARIDLFNRSTFLRHASGVFDFALRSQPAYRTAASEFGLLRSQYALAARDHRR
jgi:hypothetical protein